MKKTQFYFLSAVVALSSFFLDFFSKRWAEIDLETPIIFFENFFQFAFHQNTGVAFSIPVPPVFQIFLTLFLLGVLTHFFLTSPKNTLVSLAFGLVVGGALGNFYDRIFLGAVTDFISVWSFPIFNVADMAIFLGVSLFLLNEYLGKKK